MSSSSASRTTGRPSLNLGVRHHVIPSVPKSVLEALDRLKADTGASRVSIVSDAAAAVVGQPEFIRRIHFDLGEPRLLDVPRPFTTPRHNLTTCFPLPVYDVLCEMADAAGIRVRDLIADLAAAAAGRPDLADYMTFGDQVNSRAIHAGEGRLQLAI